MNCVNKFTLTRWDWNNQSLEEIAQEVIDGKWGNGATRRANLVAAGYNYAMVQAKVNELCKGKK